MCIGDDLASKEIRLSSENESANNVEQFGPVSAVDNSRGWNGTTLDYSRTDLSADQSKAILHYKAMLNTSILIETITHFTAPYP